MKTVICKDLEGNKHEVSVSDLSWSPAVYAVVIKDQKILLQKQWDGYAFPGGKIELGETLEEALKREMKEEAGLEIEIKKLISCETSLFKYPPPKNKTVESILIYFACKIIGGELTKIDTDDKDFVGACEWVELDKLDSFKFYDTSDYKKTIKEAAAMN